jgi:hypothetical protein
MMESRFQDNAKAPEHMQQNNLTIVLPAVAVNENQL